LDARDWTVTLSGLAILGDPPHTYLRQANPAGHLMFTTMKATRRTENPI
jgi:hypothetical protein